MVKIKLSNVNINNYKYEIADNIKNDAIMDRIRSCLDICNYQIEINCKY